MILNTLQARLPLENIGTSKGQTLQKPKTNDLSPPPGRRGAPTLSNPPLATGKTSHLKMKICPIPKNRLNLQTHGGKKKYGNLPAWELLVHTEPSCLTHPSQTLQNELHPAGVYWGTQQRPADVHSRRRHSTSIFNQFDNCCAKQFHLHCRTGKKKIEIVTFITLILKTFHWRLIAALAEKAFQPFF